MQLEDFCQFKDQEDKKSLNMNTLDACRLSMLVPFLWKLTRLLHHTFDLKETRHRAIYACMKSFPSDRNIDVFSLCIVSLHQEEIKIAKGGPVDTKILTTNSKVITKVSVQVCESRGLRWWSTHWHWL